GAWSWPAASSPAGAADGSSAGSSPTVSAGAAAAGAAGAASAATGSDGWQAASSSARAAGARARRVKARKFIDWFLGRGRAKRTAAAVRPAGSARNCAFHRDQGVGDAQGVLQRRPLYAVLAIDDEGRRGTDPAADHEVPRRIHLRV